MIKFGTSGFRGIIGDNFTKKTVKKIAYALNCIIDSKKQVNTTVAIGYDNRFMSKDFAKWMAEVLCIKSKVIFYDVAQPSPLISFKTKQFSYGIVLTASHNPYYYNGVKIFENAGEVGDEFARKIELFANNIDKEEIRYIEFNEAVKKNKITISSNISDYCESILSLLDIEKIKKSNLKILINVMHGNASLCVKYLLNKFNNTNSVIMNENIDTYFEHKLPAPYVKNLKQQSEKVVNEAFDFGVAFDGDSDRFTVIAKSGEIYDCNYFASVLYYYLLKNKKLKGDAIKNYALTNLIKKIAEANGQKCYDAKVGFKHIAPILRETDAYLGAETNGVAYQPHVLSKDGIFAFAMLVDMVSTTGLGFEEFLLEIQKEYNFESKIIEFAYPINSQKRKEIEDKLFVNKSYPNFQNRKIIKTFDGEGLQITYENDYWGMIRFSGNEPVVRIFSEMENLSECNKMVKCYEEFLGISVRQ